LLKQAIYSTAVLGCRRGLTMTDLGLAVLHHVLVFGLVAMLASELVLVRAGMSPADAARAARLDGGYGMSAGLIILVGVLRVLYGAKGPDYYLANVWFWAKMASFAAVGALSVPPTLRFLSWRKAGPAFLPEATEIARLRRFFKLQLLLVVAILVFAATMARYAAY
jgi:putative membrane protein